MKTGQLAQLEEHAMRSEVRLLSQSNWNSVAASAKFFGAVLPRRQAAKVESTPHYMLRRNTPSIMKN